MILERFSGGKARNSSFKDNKLIGLEHKMQISWSKHTFVHSLVLHDLSAHRIMIYDRNPRLAGVNSLMCIHLSKMGCSLHMEPNVVSHFYWYMKIIILAKSWYVSQT